MTSMKNLHIPLILFFLWIVSTLSAQDFSISKKYFTVEDGLSNSQVRDIYKDSKGFMWFITSAGADRYDGLDYVHYPANAEVQELSGYSKVCEDVDGNIWLGSRLYRVYHDVYNSNYSFISILNTQNNQLKSFEEKFPDCPFSVSNIMYIHQDDQYVLWLGLANGQAWKFDGQFHKIYDNGNQFPILTICPSASNTVTLGVENKILEINDKGELISTDEVPGKIMNHWVDKEGRIWLYCVSNSETIDLNHYFYVKRKSENFRPFFDLADAKYNYLDTQNRSIFSEDEQGRIWITFTTGTFIFEKSGKLFYDLSNEIGEPGMMRWVKHNSFSDNLTWFTTSESNNQGLFSLSLEKNKFRKYLSDESPPYSLRGITNINDSLFKINSYRGDLTLNINNGISKLLAEVEFKFIGLGAIKDSSGIIYSGQHSPFVSVFNPESRDATYYKLKDNIGSAVLPFIDKNNNFWLGGTKGLGYLNREKDSLIVFQKYNGFPDLKGKEIFHFYENLDGIWIATSNGLYLLNPEKGIVGHFNNFSSKRISYIYQDSDGIYWLGTDAEGMIKWNRKQRGIKNYTKEDGLSDNAIHAIFEDDFGALWMSSNYGLMRFDKSTEKINSFFEKDGIANNEFNRWSYYQHSDGSLYFGGVNGLTIFHPKDFDFKKEENKTRPVVTKFEKLDVESGGLVNQTLSFIKEKKINLNSRDKSFIVHFANLDYSHMANKRHAYKIVDLDEKWIPLEENYVRVNQLPYGDFNLKIKSIGRGGAWSNVLDIPINVAPPFYLNSGFIAFSILGFFGLVLGFIRYRTYHFRKRAEDLTIEVFKRTQIIEQQKNELEKSNKIKGKFLRLIGHDLKTPLISLSGMAQKLEFLIKEKRYDDIIKLSESIDKSSSNMTMLLDNLMNWALLQKDEIQIHPESLKLSEIVSEITTLYSDVAEAKKVQFDIEELEEFQLFADRNAMLAILRNLFDNAIKNTPKGMTVKLNASYEKGMTRIEIENSSDFINEELFRNIMKNNDPTIQKNTGGLGLLICKELTELNAGTFSISKVEGMKIIAKLVLPRSEA